MPWSNVRQFSYFFDIIILVLEFIIVYLIQGVQIQNCIFVNWKANFALGNGYKLTYLETVLDLVQTRFSKIDFTEKIWFEYNFLMCCVENSVEKREIHCHANLFPSNQFIVKLFSKTLIWRNFCEKTVAVKFLNFHSVLRLVCSLI